MVAHRRIAPQEVLKPESAVQNGVILLRRAQVEPDAPQAVKAAQAGRRYVVRVVPNEASMDRRPIGRQRRSEQKWKPEPEGERLPSSSGRCNVDCHAKRFELEIALPRNSFDLNRPVPRPDASPYA